MSVRRILLFLLALLVLAGLAGCEKYSKVMQGRVVEYDRDKGRVTVITAVAPNWENHHYLGLPPVTMTLPSDPKEMDAEPTAGSRVELNMSGKIVIYDKATQSFKDVFFTPVEIRRNVESNDPLLADAATGQPRQYPLVDRERKTITLYSKRQKVLTTVQVADEYLSLPASTWEAGDEIRGYYLEEGKIQRFSNLSKTESDKK